MIDSVTWKIGGEAGFGIMSSGTMLAKTFTHMGYQILVTNEYPSLIRGGHNLITVRIANNPFESMNRDVHILVALNKETVELHKDELSEGASIVYDPIDYPWQTSEFSKAVTLIPIPLLEIVKQHQGEPVMRNTVALGATVALMGTPFTSLEDVIKDQFKKKKQEIIDSNVAIAKAGYEYVTSHFPEVKHTFINASSNKEKLLVMNASEALGIGAVRAGLKFAAVYPMTPINAVISFLADHAKEYGLVYKQPEDEIAGITMAIGASVSGVRSMVASSGGGFALMVEGVSLAGMIETPLVIDMGMRVGPATGMPTWTEQGELQFVIHAGHGEFPRIVFAPGDAIEAFTLTIDAFNFADKYQTPVFVLTDKYLNESQWVVPESVLRKEVIIDRGKFITDGLPEDGSFKRYNVDVADGVSPRTVPGTKNGQFYANSYEHDETGLVVEDAASRIAMASKRLRKFEALNSEVRSPQVYGDSEAEITMVCWGSTKGAAIEAMKLMQQKGKKVRVVHFTWMFPFPSAQVSSLLSSSTRLIDVELNSTGQLASLIREHTGIKITEKILKFDGRPFYPEDIVEEVLAK